MVLLHCISANSQSIDYTNHTTFMPCVVQAKGKTMADTLKAAVKSTGEAKADEFMGLHGLPLLNIGFSSMVYLQAELIVSLFYTNANLAISNVGNIPPQLFALGGKEATAASAAGGAKEKPCATTTAVSYNGELTLSICINCNEEDKQILNRFLDRIEENIKLLR